jgi:hypothetical protein
MREETIKRIAYAIVVLGLMLSFIAAVVPHGTGGHRLIAAFLLWGIVPYMVYGALTEVLRGHALLVPGVLVFVIDLVIKVPERFFTEWPADSVLLLYVPILLTVVVLPLGIFVGRQLSAGPVTQDRSRAG